jgi:uncharacterized YigZ family protein
MTEPDKINVITDSFSYEMKEKGSKFLSFAFPVENEEEANNNLKNLKKKFYDASHHCYAYKLLNTYKYSDDGEPSGTAGIRILNAIEHFDLFNILLVVVRYFGGIKLGVGGLGKAYYDSSINVLTGIDIKQKFLFEKISFELPLQSAQTVYKIFNNSERKILNSTFSDSAKFECAVKAADKQKIVDEFNYHLKSKIDFQNSGKIYL